MVQLYRDFAPRAVLPSTWTDAIERLLSNFASSNFALTKSVSGLAVQVVAGTDDDEVSITVDGNPRWNTATVTAAHPGGALGTYDVYVTTGPDTFATGGSPPDQYEVDTTDHTFGLRVLAAGATPSGTGSETHYRKVGLAEWDGAKITRVVQTFGSGAAAATTAAVYSTTIGNGVATSFDVSHGLGTRDVIPVLRDSTTGELVLAEVRVLDGNVIRIITDTPPAAGGITVVLLAGASTPPTTPISAYVQTIGDGVSQSFVVPHSLNTRDVIVDVYASAAPYDTVEVDIERTDANTVTIRTPAIVPAVGALRVLVMSRGGVQGVASQHAAQHRAGGGDPIFTIGTAAPVKTVGESGQLVAGRTLTVADFTALGLSAPLGLWNLADLTDVSGNGRALTNKGAVPFGPGINGAAGEAAVFAGATTQALYIADTGATDPFRIKTGSLGCWFRTAKRATSQSLITKYTGPSNSGYLLRTQAATNALVIYTSINGTGDVQLDGIGDVCDDRWHFAVVTVDGTLVRLYLDGAVENSKFLGGPLFAANAPLNIGARSADGSTAAIEPHYGRVDEAFITSDVLSEEQIRALMARSVPHGQPGVPSTAALRVTRRKRGAALAVADFPAQPVRLHNGVGGAYTDEGSGGVTLTPNPGTGAIVAVTAPDGTRDGAWSFSGAHTGLSATDTGLPSGTSARSWGLWIKFTSFAVVGVMGWGATLGTNDLRMITDAFGRLVSKNGADDVVSGVVNDGLWHHLMTVEDNAAADAKRKLYQDGRLVGNSTILNSITLGGANRFRVGANEDGTAPFVGQISRVSVYAGALTPEQVRALYAVSSPMVPASPKDAADNIEWMDAANLYVVTNDLEPQDRIEVVAA